MALFYFSALVSVLYLPQCQTTLAQSNQQMTQFVLSDLCLTVLTF